MGPKRLHKRKDLNNHCVWNHGLGIPCRGPIRKSCSFKGLSKQNQQTGQKPFQEELQLETKVVSVRLVFITGVKKDKERRHAGCLRLCGLCGPHTIFLWVNNPIKTQVHDA